SGGLCALGIGWWSLKSSLPDTSSIFTFVRDGTLTIKSADGSILQQSGPATREKLTIRQFPKTTIEAFIAAEDRRFYKHHGVDYLGIVRATLSNVVSGDLVQGGSTITQQVARIVFLNQERSITRKLKEAMLAQELERQMPKDQILERYLNLVYLGSGAYGVADAAWVYFSKPVDKLTLPEIAMIAGLPPAPSVYSPLVNPDAAIKRRNVVLQRMFDAGYISKAEMDTAIAAPLQLKPSSPKRLVIEAPYFTSYIQQELPKHVSPEALELGGLTVETTLNRQWQKAAEKAVKDAVELDGAAEGFSQAALVAIDPRNGEVKALVGGNGYGKSQFNRVTQAQRQPGSTFKTLVYTTAIAAGFSPTDGYLDAQYTVDGYKPQNYGKTYRGWVSMRDALAYSVNVVAVKVLIDVGFDPVIKMAKDMGIHSKLMPTYSLALGASEVNLLELTSAYGTLAAEGNAIPPHGIVRILNRQGKVLYDADFKPKRVVDKGTASIMTWMLENVVQYGTGRPAQLGRPVAGKT
ncbi:MAG TPA: PBP1A family penicillin-binding protein, partial [Candidatus Obscuribacterales bacterium]